MYVYAYLKIIGRFNLICIKMALIFLQVFVILTISSFELCLKVKMHNTIIMEMTPVFLSANVGYL